MLIWILAVAGALLVELRVSAQVVLDGSLGPGGALPGPEFQLPADLGRQVGGNLFHSFREFNLASGESATFSGPASIGSIIARVTGGSASHLNGLLRSTIPGADFYFINPWGVLFGPDARLDVGGSFTATTADYLQASDGARFHARNPDASLLTTAPVEAFGFLGGTRTAIEVSGSQLNVQSGKTLTLAAANIDLGASQPRPPIGDGPDIEPVAGSLRAGRVQLLGIQTSVETVHSVQSDPANSTSPPSGGSIHIHDKTSVLAGQLMVRARELQVDNATLSASDALGGEPPMVDARIESRLSVEADGRLSLETSGTAGRGSIRLETSEVHLRSGGRIESTSVGIGPGGSIRVEADEILATGLGFGVDPARLGGQANFTADLTGIRSTSAPGAGAGGDISIAARRLELAEGASVVTLTEGAGRAGDIRVQSDDVEIRQGAPVPAGIYSSSRDSGEGGRTGDVLVDTRNLTVYGDRASLQTAGLGTVSRGFGDSGDVTVRADSILLDGRGYLATINSDALVTDPSNLARRTGRAGDIKVEARTMHFVEGGSISATSQGSGDAGSIQVTTDSLNLWNRAGVASVLNSSAGNGVVREGTPPSGDGGDIRVEAKTIDIQGRAGIITFTYGTGRAGNIDVAAEEIRMDGLDVPSGAGISTVSFDPGAGGPAGNIDIRTGLLDIRSGGSASAVSAATLGQGNGGAIRVQAREIFVDARGSAGGGFGVGIGAQSLSFGSGGNGGSIAIEADSLTLVNRGVVSTLSLGSGRAGDISIETRQGIALENNSEISTTAVQSDAEGIAVQAGSSIQLRGSRISSAAARNGGDMRLGAGSHLSLDRSEATSQAGVNGGNILLNPALLVLNRGILNANAVFGDGGNIQVGADFFLASADSRVTASSTFGVDGEISILGPSIDLTGSLTPLAAMLLAADSRLPERCTIRLSGDLSSFVITGRGGLPLTPDGWQPSPLGDRSAPASPASPPATPPNPRPPSPRPGP